MTKGIQPSYCTKVPGNQTAVDIFQGLWKSAFPPESGIQAGDVPNFDDPRVDWVAQRIGGLRRKSVLELGPFEGYNTWQFSRAGAAPITAIEGNNINYLKCLVAKETLGISARFLHGDLKNFLDDTPERYDLCWACGVLYHQLEPLRLLQSIARVCDRVFIWTHFYDDRIADNPKAYPHFDSRRNVEKKLDDYHCQQYYRSYRFGSGGVPSLFSGGNGPFSYWLSRDDILGYMKTLGFTDVTIRGVNMEHKAGPTISFLARRGQGRHAWKRRLTSLKPARSFLARHGQGQPE